MQRCIFFLSEFSLYPSEKGGDIKTGPVFSVLPAKLE